MGIKRVFRGYSEDIKRVLGGIIPVSPEYRLGISLEVLQHTVAHSTGVTLENSHRMDSWGMIYFI